MSDGDPLGMRAAQERQALAQSIYAAMRNTGTASKHRVLIYRCSGRDTLADVVDGGSFSFIVGQPRYKTSPAVTAATSTDSGRRANTEDGDRHWKGQANYLDDTNGLLLACDHLHMVALADSAIRDDLAAGHSEVVVRSDGTRFAIR